MSKKPHPLNILRLCESYNVSLWSCPPFLFIIMGLIIIGVIILTYFIGQQYLDPIFIALIVLIVSGFLFIISFIIVRAFEKVVDARRREAQQSKDLLEIKDQFVFIAAHELRTPANAIKWGLGALKMEEPELFKKQKELYDIIWNSNERLLNLVKDLLEVARLDSKNIKIKLGQVSLSDAIVDALKETESLAEEQHITIHNQISSDTPHVFSDQIRLKEIFINLLSNAIKYNKKSGEIWISRELKGNYIVVHIKDSGMGISPKYHNEVFKKFARTEETRGIEGTGLGLFIVKQLTELMDGKIWFKSTLGEGTTFSLSLRAHELHGQSAKKS